MDLYLNSTKIWRVNAYRFLGLSLDARLSGKPEADAIDTTSSKFTNAACRLGGQSWGKLPSSMLRLQDTVVTGRTFLYYFSYFDFQISKCYILNAFTNNASVRRWASLEQHPTKKCTLRATCLEQHTASIAPCYKKLSTTVHTLHKPKTETALLLRFEAKTEFRKNKTFTSSIILEQFTS